MAATVGPMTEVARRVRDKIGKWFVLGTLGWLIGGPLVFLFGVADGNPVGVIAGGLVVLVGWSAMLVAIVAKGVELGVRAANDE